MTNNLHNTPCKKFSKEAKTDFVFPEGLWSQFIYTLKILHFGEFFQRICCSFAATVQTTFTCHMCRLFLYRSSLPKHFKIIFPKDPHQMFVEMQRKCFWHISDRLDIWPTGYPVLAGCWISGYLLTYSINKLFLEKIPNENP